LQKAPEIDFGAAYAAGNQKKCVDANMDGGHLASNLR
jgi:hypothetical protein